jgi:uncharacterized repeat protein (TIGR01451 family)
MARWSTSNDVGWPNIRRLLRGLAVLIMVSSATFVAAAPALLSLTATVRPTKVTPGETVTYTISLVNDRAADLTSLTLADDLPSGFAYLPGSSAMRINGGLVSLNDPRISGRRLSWSLNTLRASEADWYYGIHTFVQDSCDSSHIDAQLNAARELMGAGAFVKQLFYGITTNTIRPRDCWVYFVNKAYDLNLQPVVRLQGLYAGDAWAKPPADSPGNYVTIARAFQRVVAGLPRRDGHNLFVEIWNEPNLNVEWGNDPNPREYAHFLLDVGQAIRALGDSRIVILNGGLAPGGDINHLDFIDGMATVPGALEAFDVWASHPYPANHPPEYNVHDGTAAYSVATIDTYLLELDRLAQHGRPGLHVLLTETGHNLGNNVFGFEGYQPVDESNRADYMVRAFRDYWRVWPEVLGVTPFELVDPHNRWATFDWLYPSGAHHQQYDAVAALGKSAKQLPTQLSIVFRARAAFTPGLYASRVEASASNATIGGTGDTAWVTVLAPTATPTPTQTPSPTVATSATSTPTPSTTPYPGQTPTATPTPLPCDRYDLDNDGAITVADIMAVAGIWGTTVGDPRYDAAYDFNGDGRIDVVDIMLVADHWGESCPTVAAQAAGPLPTLRPLGGLRAVARRPTSGRLLGITRTDLVIPGQTELHIPLGGDLRAIAVSTDGETAYVSDSAGGRVLVVDATDRRVRGEIRELSDPTGLVVGKRGLWVSESGAGRLTLVNRRTYGIIARVPVGRSPGVLVYDGVAGRLYAAVTGQGSVAVVNDDGAVEAVWPVGGIGLPQGAVFDVSARRLYVAYAISPRYGAIAVYDVDSGERISTWRGSASAPFDPLLALALDRSGKRLFAVGAASWWAIDTWSGTARRFSKPVGAVSPFGLAFTPLDNALWFAHPRQ